MLIFGLTLFAGLALFFTYILARIAGETDRRNQEILKELNKEDGTKN